MRKTVTKKEVDSSLPSKETLKELYQYLRTPFNRKILRGLFLETFINNKDEEEEGYRVQPIFTLKEWNVEKDGKTYYSLKNIYFSYNHIPGYEYEFAKDVFNSWDHWAALANCSGAVREHIDQWKDELTIRLQAQAYQALAKTAVYEGAKGTPAAKFLADRGWEAKRGRPSKEEITKNSKLEAGVRESLEEDMARLGLTIVK
jgi:hypothetical protein